jgi:hypothetical protein
VIKHVCRALPPTTTYRHAMGRAVFVVIALAATGCGSRCKDVAAARTALTARAGTPNRTADVEVAVPMVRANTVMAELLQQKPMSVPLDVPDLGLVAATLRPLTATVREVKLVPGSAGKVRFVVQLAVDDPDQQVTMITATAEVEPVLTRANGAAELAIGLGPQNVLKLRPELGAEGKAKLGSAVTRWMPEKLKDRLPQPLVDAAAAKLGSHLTGAAWTVLQKTLLVKLGEVTTMKLRLPDVPVARVDVRSISAPDVLLVEISSDLPIRAGLSPLAAPPAEISVRIAGSAAAELANWAIDQGHAPQWYTRSLTPSPKGEFRPRFDYLPGKSHPLKVYAFQERGGCSYFKVGVNAKLGMDGTKLVATATDRDLETSEASTVIEIAAWAKYFLTGWVDRSKKVAAHTRLAVGSRALETQVISASLAHDELTLGLQFTAPPQATALNGSAMSRPSAGSSGGIKNSSR